MMKKVEAEAIVYTDILDALDNTVEPELMRTFNDQQRRKLAAACKKFRALLLKRLLKLQEALPKEEGKG